MRPCPLSRSLRLRPALSVLVLLLCVATAGHAQQTPPIVPNPSLTPGATLPVTKDDLCVPGYTKKVRNVPQSVKNQVYAEYGITHHAAGEYEVDHLISLELGGSNSIKNLWPESYQTQPWNAHVKDALEDRLHAMVCAGQIDLATAQHAIATDWIGEYKQIFHTQTPLTAGTAGTRKASRRRRRSGTGAGMGAASGAVPQPQIMAGGQVWVNTKSGKYFAPGSRY